MPPTSNAEQPRRSRSLALKKSTRTSESPKDGDDVALVEESQGQRSAPRSPGLSSRLSESLHLQLSASSPSKSRASRSDRSQAKTRGDVIQHDEDQGDASRSALSREESPVARRLRSRSGSGGKSEPVKGQGQGSKDKKSPLEQNSVSGQGDDGPRSPLTRSKSKDSQKRDGKNIPVLRRTDTIEDDSQTASRLKSPTKPPATPRKSPRGHKSRSPASVGTRAAERASSEQEPMKTPPPDSPVLPVILRRSPRSHKDRNPGSPVASLPLLRKQDTIEDKSPDGSPVFGTPRKSLRLSQGHGSRSGIGSNTPSERDRDTTEQKTPDRARKSPRSPVTGSQSPRSPSLIQSSSRRSLRSGSQLSLRSRSVNRSLMESMGSPVARSTPENRSSSCPGGEGHRPESTERSSDKLGSPARSLKGQDQRSGERSVSADEEVTQSTESSQKSATDGTAENGRKGNTFRLEVRKLCVCVCVFMWLTFLSVTSRLECVCVFERLREETFFDRSQ